MPANIFRNDPTTANRYLADQLTDAERAVFEARLLDDAAAMRELEATARFKLGLQKLRNSRRLDELVNEPTRRVPWLLTAAAAAALLVLSIGVLRWNAAPAPMLAATVTSLVDRDGAHLVVSNVYAVFHQRAGEGTYDALLPLPPSRQAIELRVLPDAGPQQPPPYRASLTRIPISGDTSAEATAAIADLSPAADGFVSIFVDSAQLRPGDYQLDLTSQAVPRIESTAFVIRVVPVR